MGHESAELHSDRTLAQRRAALDGFKNGTYRVLVATDIAARGIDVTHIAHVINYDLPQVAEDYIHRIGRTARAGADGQAISLLTPEDRSQWKEITRLLRRTGSQVPETQAPKTEKRGA
jgi:ATP-dependent RNA helicase RhlE